MPTNLDVIFKEEGTGIVGAAFTDEDASAVTPNAITWTLTDAAGTVINSREDVAVASPDTSIDIVLSGDDLQILTAEASQKYVERLILVKSTYDSSLGSDLPAKQSGAFLIENLVAVS